MLARSIFTLVIFLMSANAFWIGALDGDHVFNPTGIAFLLLSAFVWLRWDAIANAFKSVMSESNIPILRLGAAIIGGMRRFPQPMRRSSGEA